MHSMRKFITAFMAALLAMTNIASAEYVRNDPINRIDPAGKQSAAIANYHLVQSQLKEGVTVEQLNKVGMAKVGLAAGGTACAFGGCQAAAGFYIRNAFAVNSSAILGANLVADPGNEIAGAGALIKQARGMMSGLQGMHASGKTTEAVLEGYTVVYQSDLPMEAMTLTADKGFAIGPKAFESSESLAKTVLHELRRLDAGMTANGVSPDVAKAATDDAFNFAEEYYKNVLE